MSSAPAIYVNDKIVSQGDIKSQSGKFTLSGEGLCIGHDSGDAVSEEYKTPGTFKGSAIQFLGVTVEKAQYLDLRSSRMPRWWSIDLVK